jgi:hypothetical protein
LDPRDAVGSGRKGEVGQVGPFTSAILIPQSVKPESRQTSLFSRCP